MLRSLKRGETATAMLAAARFSEQAVSMTFLLNKRYMPFYKWAHRGVEQLPILGKETAGCVTALAGLDWRLGPRVEAVAGILWNRCAVMWLGGCARTVCPMPTAIGWWIMGRPFRHASKRRNCRGCPLCWNSFPSGSHERKGPNGPFYPHCAADCFTALRHRFRLLRQVTASGLSESPRLS